MYDEWSLLLVGFRCVCAWISLVVPFIELGLFCSLSHRFDCFLFTHTSCCCCCCGVPFTSRFWSRLVLVLLPFNCYGAIHPPHVTVQFNCGKNPVLASFKYCSEQHKKSVHKPYCNPALVVFNSYTYIDHGSLIYFRSHRQKKIIHRRSFVLAL